MNGLPRLKKICGYGYIVMFLAAAVFVSLALITAGLGIASFFGSNLLYTWLSVNANAPTVTVVFAFLANLLIWVIAAITVAMIGAIMRSIKREHSPFTLKNASRMKMLSVAYLISSFLMLAFEFLADKKASEAVFVFMGLLLVAVVLYCLTLMCRYGALLQKESDETL